MPLKQQLEQLLSDHPFTDQQYAQLLSYTILIINKTPYAHHQRIQQMIETLKKTDIARTQAI